MTDPRLPNDLGRYWDDLVEGRPAGPGELDPEFASLIRQLHAQRDDVPSPDAGYVTTLREDLMNQPAFAIPLRSAERTPTARNGLGTPRVRQGGDEPLAHLSVARGSGWARLIAAALLLMALGVAYLALRPFGNGPGQPSSLPAAVGSPIAAPAVTPDPQTALGTLVDVLLPGGLSTPAQYVDIERLTFSTDGGSAVNPMNKSNFVLLVLSGQVTTTISSATQRYKGLNATSMQSVAAGAPQLLQVGDALVVGAGSYLRIEHQGAVPAIVLSLNVLDVDLGNPGLNRVSIQQLASTAATFSAAPLHLVLRRVALVPGQTIPAPAAGSVQLVAPEQPLPPGKLQTNPDRSVTNLDTKSLPVLILTIDQAGGNGMATPAAATPAA